MQRFVERGKESDIDVMLCEGTRVNKRSSRTEADFENDAKKVMNGTRGLVLCSYPPSLHFLRRHTYQYVPTSM